MNFWICLQKIHNHCSAYIISNNTSEMLCGEKKEESFLNWCLWPKTYFMQAHKGNSIALAHIGSMFPGELIKKPWLKSPMRLDLSGLRNYIQFCLQYTLEGQQTDRLYAFPSLFEASLVTWLGAYAVQHTRAQNIKFHNNFLSFALKSLTQSFSGRINDDIHWILQSSSLD